MDEGKYSTLVAMFKTISDPRKARGQRHGWGDILTLIAAALASGQVNGRGIAQWVREHATELSTHMALRRGQVPSEATIRRALRQIDVDQVEAGVAGLAKAAVARRAPRAGLLEGLAIDGKAVRGANRHGRRLHLVSLVRHAEGLVLRQVAVADKRNEISAARDVLRGHDLTGTVVTMDALLTQRDLAQQILAQHGDYLMIVKENHPTLYAAIALLFDVPPWQGGPFAEEVQQVQTHSKGHGRRDSRTLRCSTALADYLDWPGVAHVCRRTCRRVILKTGQVQEDTTFAITSLPRSRAGAPELEALWRGHWTIENKVHYPRDVSLAEDRCQIHTGAAPHALAAMRNAVLTLIRAKGWRLVPDALRHYGASVDRALGLLGVPGL